MKKIVVLVISTSLVASAYTQSLRVTFNGNKDFQLVVDGKTYNSTNYTNDDVVLNQLEGKHNVAVYKINRNGRSKQLYSSSVDLSSNQEVHLTINNNGSISREETSSNAAYSYRTPMSGASFNEVYRSVNNQWGQSAKMSEARDIFNNSSYYFSTEQIERIVGLLNSEANRLELLKLAYDNVTDPANYNQLNDLLRSQASINELDNYTRNNSYGDTYKNYKVAMSSSNFNKLYQDVAKQRNTSRKLSAATKAFNTASNYFSVQQVIQIISIVSGDNNRLQLAKLSLDNTVDVENFSQLFSLLTAESARQELDYYIRNNGYAAGDYNYSTHVAMTESEFTTLYDNIRKKWLPLSKYSTAVDVFNSTSNYFTTSQVRKIIALLSSESNRLDLAKLAFDNIVDQQNFRQLYDLFTSQSSKDELDSYIKSNYNYQY